MPFLPLEGMRVVDVTTSIAGPYCAEILGALGADVVKVERPDTGDDGRAWGPPFWNGESAMFLAVNAEQALARRIARATSAAATPSCGSPTAPTSSSRAFAPGSRSGSASGADVVRARNPRIVYCSIGAYGPRRAARAEPGYDALMQAAGGLISMTGEPGRPGVRVGSSLIDMGTGMWAALGIVAALLEREQTGRGTRSSTRRSTRRPSATSATTSSATWPTARFRPGRERCSRWSRRTRCSRPATASSWSPEETTGSSPRSARSLDAPRARRRRALPHEPRPRPRTARTLVAILSDRLREQRHGRLARRASPRAGVPAAPVADVADVVAVGADAGARDSPAARARRPSRTSRCRRSRCRSTASGRRTVSPAVASASTRRRCSARSGYSTTRSPRSRRRRRQAGLIGVYSYAIASSGSSFAARRAGKIAATIPTTIAAIDEDDDLRRRERRRRGSRRAR